MVAGIGSHWEQVHYLSAVISASGSADSASDLDAIQVRKRVGVNCLSTLLLALCRANFVLFYTSCWCSTWSRRWPSLKILAGEGVVSLSTACTCLAIIILATGTGQLPPTWGGPIMGIKQAAHSSHRATAESRAGAPVIQASTPGTRCHRRCVTS